MADVLIYGDEIRIMEHNAGIHFINSGMYVDAPCNVGSM